MSSFFTFKGNYFNDEFHLPKTTGTDAVEKIIKRESPCDTDTLLYECPVEYRHVPLILESAQSGFSVWRNTPTEQRIEHLQKFASIVQDRHDEFARSIALEAGKPLWEAKTEASAIVSKVKVTIEDSLPRIANKFYDEIMPGTKGHLRYKPVGPCLVIGPFNYPCHLPNGQILSALISGNSIIFKPSEKTAHSAQLLIECLAASGFPKGVINLAQGDGEMASRLVRAKEVKGIFFTGSKEVGLKITSATHQDLNKLVSLELGGKNIVIAHEDTDMNHTLGELLKGAFYTTGQRCTSVAVVAIHRKIHQEFIEKFHALAKRIIVDHPLDHECMPFMGPLIDQRSVESYLLFMGMAKREGITEIMRGKQLEKKFNGYYVGPSVHLAESWDPKSHFLSSEIFGPNCTFVPYDDIDEAIAITNGTEYGLASAVFTQSAQIADHCYSNIDSGIFNINRSTAGASAKLPFGGVKNSGNYRPAAVSTIDSCVYQMAGLEVPMQTGEIEDITGLM